MTSEPLASRMRPVTLSDVVGQDHLIGAGKFLTLIVEQKRPTNLILYGAPGVGKTSIAHALAHDLGVPYRYFNAGVHPKKELQDIAKDADPSSPVLVFIDEIHRLDKPKQDFLLMQLEVGALILIGATTENPYINLNPALRSRSHILELNAVTPDAIAHRLETVLHEDEVLAKHPLTVTREQLVRLAQLTHGDVRSALNTLELAILAAHDAGSDTLDDAHIEMVAGRPLLALDKDGDSHYNLLSALQKSIRGSDADAALHYLARLIAAGDLVSINRRLLVIAYEDIGLADPSVVQDALAAVTSAERLGFPEARIPLAYLTSRLALSAKSNVAYKALDAASADLSSGRDMTIPKHLQDAHYKGAASLGRGVDYKYPHDYLHGIVRQQYLPDAYAHARYLTFRDEGDTADAQATYTNINRFIKD